MRKWKFCSKGDLEKNTVCSDCTWTDELFKLKKELIELQCCTRLCNEKATKNVKVDCYYYAIQNKAGHTVNRTTNDDDSSI